MEYSLTRKSTLTGSGLGCLNPYSNGILTDFAFTLAHFGNKSLNPYSNGILTDILDELCLGADYYVLILILMEYSLTVGRMVLNVPEYLS